MDEQILSLKDSLRVVLRCRRILAVLGIVGLLLGIVYAVAVPALVSAKTEVLLPQSPLSSSGTPSRDVQTEVDIATSPVILNPAAKAAGINLPYTTLQHRVVASGLTTDVVQIVAKAPNASQAENLANSVAAQFVTYLSNQSSVLASGVSVQLSQEIQQLESGITDYNDQIASTKQAIALDPPGSTKAAEDQSLLDAANTALDYSTVQLRIVKTLLAQAALEGNSSAGTSVFQHATSAIKPSVLRVPELGLIGLAGGLFIGICAAFVVGRRNRRLHQRDEIAHATGAPVLASLTTVRGNKSENLLQLLEHFRPSVSNKANLRRLLDELGVHKYGARFELTPSQNGTTGQNGSSVQNGSSHHEAVEVSVFVLAGDDKAVVAITQLPAFAASLGLPVALVVDGSNTSTEQLAIACAARDPLDLASPRPNLLTYASAPTTAPEGVSLTVTVEIVDPATVDVGDATNVNPSVDRLQSALLVVSSGFATPEDLEVVAQASEHHGRPLVGVIVANPERSDKTSGQQPPRRVLGLHGPRQLSALRSSTR